MIGYCVICRDYVPYITKQLDSKKEIKGVFCSFKELHSYCKFCNSEIWVSSINDTNLKMLEKKYKEVVDKSR